MIPRLFSLLNLQGLIGLAASLGLSAMLLAAKIDARHWQKQSTQFEQLYHAGQQALAQTVAGYRAAADAARAADRAAADRVLAEQRQINERTANDFEIRLADARDRARRLQLSTAPAATDSCARGATSMSGLPTAPCRIAQATGENRLPPDDALIATEQALQLEALIRWVKAQHAVNPNRDEAKRP